ncbi:MAG TPA: sulfotransferase [Gemmataceae bacterium]|nr:sulfotransferase [Gemmataceae bacterium]
MPGSVELLRLAHQAQQTGELQRAEELCLQVLQADPLNADALRILETAYQVLGKQLDHAQLYNQLGHRLLARRQLPEAALCYQQAVRRQPNLSQALNNLGNIRAAQGNLEEAADYLQRAINSEGNNPEAYSNLAVVQRLRGRPAAAEACARAAISLKPDSAHAHRNLGLTLRELDRRDEAVACFREVIRCKPEWADAHNNLGLALKDLGRLQEAIASFEYAAQLAPDWVDPHSNHGVALTEQGNIPEAIGRFQHCLRLNPDYAQAYYNLSELAAAERYQFSIPEIAHMRMLLSRDKLSCEDASLLHYTLATLANNLGNYDEAFSHYARANELQKKDMQQRGIAFDAAQCRRFVERVMAVCNDAYFQHVRAFGTSSELPVFIVGMPRSGTSLVEQILASHPHVFGSGERSDIQHLAMAIRQQLHISASYPECLASLDSETTAALADSHVQRLQSVGGHALRVVDKMPGNFHFLGLIATLFPRARIIHCRRDPLDTCVSCFCQNFRSLNYAQSLEDLGAHYRQYERLMAHWHAVLPMAIHDVCYEQLVSDPDTVMRDLVAFLGLEWNDRCRQFHENRRAISTPSKFQVRQPLFARSVGRWKRFEAHLQPLLEALGDSALSA